LLGGGEKEKLVEGTGLEDVKVGRGGGGGRRRKEKRKK